MEEQTLDIDDLLGEGGAPLKLETSKEVVGPSFDGDSLKEGATPTKITDLRDRQILWNNKCRDVFLDLRHMIFHADEEDMYLEIPSYNNPVYFKKNPSNPKDPNVIHSQKQFCKLVGIPHSFFMNNRPKLKEDIVRTWQSGLNSEKDSARCVARIREAESFSTLRAIIKSSHSVIKNDDILSALLENMTIPLYEDFVYGDEKDDLILHVRYTIGNKYNIMGRDVCPGFSLIISELGATSLRVDPLLYDIKSKSSFIASFGGKPFFTSKYEDIQSSILKETFKSLSDKINETFHEMNQRVEQLINAHPEIDCDDECAKFVRRYKVPGKFSKALYHEVSLNSSEISNSLDFAVRASLVAKDFDHMKRLKIESSIGSYLNLAFARS